MLTIPHTTAEKLRTTITTPVDPTGTLPRFALTSQSEENPATAVWVNGEWEGSYDEDSGQVAALTPLVGLGQSLPLVPGTIYKLWVDFTGGTESPDRLIGLIRST